MFMFWSSVVRIFVSLWYVYICGGGLIELLLLGEIFSFMFCRLVRAGVEGWVARWGGFVSTICTTVLGECGFVKISMQVCT